MCPRFSDIKALLFVLLCYLLIIFSCISKKKAETSKSPMHTENKINTISDDKLIKNELIIKMVENANMDSLLFVFKNYNLRIKKELSSEMKIWLLEYDTTSIKPLVMLDMMKGNKVIAEAQFNKKIKLRY